MPPKNWDKIVSDIPTPPDSDEEDVLNVEMVKKNALRVSDLLHHMMPNLPTELAGDLPKGMNRIGDFNNHIRKQFHQSTEGVLREALQASRAKNGPQLAGHGHGHGKGTRGHGSHGGPHGPPGGKEKGKHGNIAKAMTSVSHSSHKHNEGESWDGTERINKYGRLLK